MQNSENYVVLQWDLLTKKNQTTKDRKFAVNYTQDKVMVTISKVRFSDEYVYWLHLESINSSNSLNLINITVSDKCKLEIFQNNNTNELICEAEGMEQNATIYWMDNHTHVYQSTRREKLSKDKLRIYLNLTKEMKNIEICCVVSHQKDVIYEENKTCLGETPGKETPQSKSLSEKQSLTNSKNFIASVVAIFLVVALVAAALGYLIKSRNKMDIRDIPGEENTTIPPLLPPQTV
ncbi:uncharacterized protein [Phyllobates terribilis]|uniref:uncharacterized protein n=1 Tax=Phyllobates terribilis TaxID=111132 RepID=UPI003CCAA0EF